MNRDDDLTFSFGRGTSYDEVVGLLCDSGCMDAERYLDQIRSLRINNKKMDNGQVKITCLAGESDDWVNKLSKYKGLIKCHSYTNNQVQVKFSYVHAKVDVERDIIGSFLASYKVKEYWADVDFRYGIPNGGYTFIMYNDELQAKPLEECVYFNNEACWISYATRPVRCHNCDNIGHMADECTKQREAAFPPLKSADGADIWLPGVQSLKRTRKLGAAAAVIVEGREAQNKENKEGSSPKSKEHDRSQTTTGVQQNGPAEIVLPAVEAGKKTDGDEESEAEDDKSTASENSDAEKSMEDDGVLVDNGASQHHTTGADDNSINLRPGGSTGKGNRLGRGRGIPTRTTRGVSISNRLSVTPAIKRGPGGDGDDDINSGSTKAARTANKDIDDFFEANYGVSEEVLNPGG